MNTTHSNDVFNPDDNVIGMRTNHTSVQIPHAHICVFGAMNHRTKRFTVTCDATRESVLHLMAP